MRMNKKEGLRPPSVPLLEAFDLFLLDHPLLIPAVPAHPRELDGFQLTIPDEPHHRIPTNGKFTGSLFNAQQHTLLSFLPLPFREVLKSRALILLGSFCTRPPLP